MGLSRFRSELFLGKRKQYISGHFIGGSWSSRSVFSRLGFLGIYTAFLLTVARRIKFVTAEHLPVRTALSLSRHMKRVLDVYGRAGFRVRTILMDDEFEKLKPLMPSVECNTTAAKEHVSETERTIRTLKEQVRGLLNTLPFENLPRRMKIEFIYFMVLWMNEFPVKSGVSD